ncbi:MAG: hypothetical protein IJS63_06090 [Bacteroidaceae bacterium]|nr:hypothetical protein [Bacteroidaceae bacterium]
MKKTYICPAIDLSEAEAAQMLAESLIISSETTVDGSEALTKEDGAWNIWNDDAE